METLLKKVIEIDSKLPMDLTLHKIIGIPEPARVIISIFFKTKEITINLIQDFKSPMIRVMDKDKNFYSIIGISEILRFFESHNSMKDEFQFKLEEYLLIRI